MADVVPVRELPTAGPGRSVVRRRRLESTLSECSMRARRSGFAPGPCIGFQPLGNTSQRWRSWVVAALIAGCCAIVLHALIYTNFERLRVVVVRTSHAAAGGAVAVPLPDLSPLVGQPAAVVLPLSGDRVGVSSRARHRRRSQALRCSACGWALTCLGGRRLAKRIPSRRVRGRGRVRPALPGGGPRGASCVRIRLLLAWHTFFVPSCATLLPDASRCCRTQCPASIAGLRLSADSPDVAAVRMPLPCVATGVGGNLVALRASALSGVGRAVHRRNRPVS